MSIHSLHVVHFNAFISKFFTSIHASSFLSIQAFNLLMSIHSCHSRIHSFKSFRSFQFIHFKSLIPIRSCQVIHFNSCQCMCFIHSLTDSFVRSLIFPQFMKSFIDSFSIFLKIQLILFILFMHFTHVSFFICSFIQSFVHLFIHSVIHSFIHLFVHLFIHSFVKKHPCIHSFTHFI